jgi:hypothetical protein
MLSYLGRVNGAAIMPVYVFAEYRVRFIAALRALAKRVADHAQAAHADELANGLEERNEFPLGGERRESPEDHAVIFWAVMVRFRASPRFRYWLACNESDIRIPRGEGEAVAVLVQQQAKLTTEWILRKVNEYRDMARTVWLGAGITFDCDPEKQTYVIKGLTALSQGDSSKPDS